MTVQVEGLNDWRTLRSGFSEHQSIGFVPTMGALHEGHLSLIGKSADENDSTVVSIFVNPTQFGPDEDYLKYPRTLDKDIAAAEQVGVDVVFLPSVETIYPNKR